jgi:hypothetical protein
MTSMLSRTSSRPEQAAWVLFGFLLASGQIAAHHGTRVSYDSTNPTRITGTVTEFVWRNPHARLFFDVTDEEGNVVNWGGEMTSPTTLARSGWTRTTLEPGDTLTVVIYPSRAGTNVGEVSRTEPMFANGVRLPQTSGAPALVGSVPRPQEDGYDARDLSGVWVSSGGPRRSVTGEEPESMTPQGQAKYDSRLPSYGPRAIPPALGNDPAGECNPVGVTRMLLSIRPFEIIHVSDRVIQLFEGGRTWRDLWADGRELPVGQDSRWLGYSVGQWQGDTFVVETTGFDDRTWLDSYANPHSEDLRLTERWRRTGFDTLELDMVIRDPKIYTVPVVVETKTYALLSDHELQEVFCAPVDEGSFNERIRNPAGGLEPTR